MFKWIVSISIIVASVLVGIGLWLGADIKLIVGGISLVGVICTVCVTTLNGINTNKLTKELGEQTRKLTKELGEQTYKLTKELGEKNLKALEQKRYIDAISVERTKWINTMRDKFSEYLKLAHIQMNDFDKWKFHDDRVSNQDEVRNRSFEITYVNNYINLLLNPKEPVTEELIKLQKKITDALSTNNVQGFEYEYFADLVKDLSYFYQVILKAEWKRVKEENKKGQEIDEETMNKIFIETAKKMNNKTYDKYFNQSES